MLTRTGHPVVTALDAVEAALDEARAAQVWEFSDDDLAATLERCEQLAARQAELALRLVGEVDARDLGRRLGGTSTAAWLRHRLRLRAGEARTRVELANRLATGTQGPVDYAANVATAAGRGMPATRAALVAGEVSIDHARVIAGVVGRLPDQLEPERVAAAEADLAGWAREHDPAVLARLGRYLLDVLDADALPADEERAAARRELSINDTDGRIRGQLDPEAIAILRSALDPLAAPQPAADGTPDPRPHSRRLADALVELARRSLDHGELFPARRGVRPHLNITVGLDSLRAGGTTPRSPGECSWGGPLSAAAVRRIACDAGITLVITDPAGIPLNVGREHRTVTPAQWIALVVRDGGCTFPGCDRPPEWCQAHHIKHWADGGPTDLANLVLLCGHHHRSIHHRGWDIRIATDQRPEFFPPPWIDPARPARRNTRPRHHRRDLPAP